jgi:Protein of unknown function (DUF2752)
VVTTRQSRLATLRAPLAAAGVALLAWTYVSLVDPNIAGRYPVCPLRALTGLDCPFCGGTRAAHALAHGDVAAALDHNLLVTLAIPVAVVLWVRWAWRQWRGQPTSVTVDSRLALALIGVLVAFMVIRNLPGFGYLRST